MSDKLWFTLVEGKIERATNDSAAFDLFYNGDRPIIIGDRPTPIPTGVKTAFDPRLVAIIKEKSGLASKGIELKAGVIDADYKDEWIVIARNPIWLEYVDLDHRGIPTGNFEIRKATNWMPFVLEPGKKIAQFLLVERPMVQFNTSPGNAALNLKAEERKGGFGSTGS